MGSVFCIFFSSYGLAIWYGGKLIISKGYSGGDIINILFAVMTGAMFLLTKIKRKQFFNDPYCINDIVNL
jgi:hypothetical protein